jgi:hypothetical protein
MRRRILRVGLAASVALAVAIPAQATATTYSANPPVNASSPSPFVPCTGGNDPGTPPGTNFPNSEVEPFAAVNPTDPNNIIGVYQQDRWSNGGAHGLVAAVSHDGGLTWPVHSWAHFSKCSGGTVANGGDIDRASDPWVTFSPNGHAYFMSLSASADLTTSAMLVATSTDGGDTWSEPTTLIRETSDFHFNDKNSITADPTDSRYVYAVWDRSRHPSENAGFNALHSAAFRGDIYFTRTTDGGQTWEPARAIFAPRANLFTIGNQIAVQPDGTLVDIFALGRGSGRQPSVNQFFEAVVISTDKGVSWSRPVIISTDQSVDVRDPDTGANVRAGEGLPDIAVDPNSGTLYAVWDDGRFNGRTYDEVVFSQSTDGGQTWSAPIRVNQTPSSIPVGDRQAFTPAVHVASDGTVAVSYYDFRHNTSAPGLGTDAWLVHCHSACTDPTSWSETQLAGPFNLELAPVARGYFVGDYEGLTSIGTDLVAFFAQAGPTTGQSDVYSVRAHP